MENPVSQTWRGIFAIIITPFGEDGELEACVVPYVSASRRGPMGSSARRMPANSPPYPTMSGEDGSKSWCRNVAVGFPWSLLSPPDIRYLPSPLPNTHRRSAPTAL